MLRCGVSNQGALTHCVVVSESPGELGFAAAALSLTRDFKVYTNLFAPRDVEAASVDLPFDFHQPGLPSQSVQVTNPIWLQLPEPSSISQNFPRDAAKVGLNTGLAVLRCDVTHYGKLADCAVAREDPPGSGFGAAALIVAKDMSMNPWTRAGTPVDGAQLLVPIRLNQGTAETSSPPLGDIKIVDFGEWTRKDGTAGPFTPDRACRMGVRKALAVIDCKVGLDGTLSACSVVDESPRDFGFGAAAIKMAQRHFMTSSPVLVDGRPVADHVVRLSLPFSMPPGGCSMFGR
jgi:hypothetical protein